MVMVNFVNCRITAIKQRVSTWMGDYCIPPPHTTLTIVKCCVTRGGIILSPYTLSSPLKLDNRLNPIQAQTVRGHLYTFGPLSQYKTDYCIPINSFMHGEITK